MAQIWIEIEENPNCGYLPLRTYSSIGEEQSARSVLLAYTEGGELTEVTGWGPDNGGSPCDVHWVRAGDSGEGESVLVYGGDWGGQTPAVPKPNGVVHDRAGPKRRTVLVAYARRDSPAGRMTLIVR